MGKLDIIPYIRSQGYACYLDDNFVVMVEIPTTNKKSSEKAFKQLERDVKEQGYTGSIGWKEVKA